MIPEGFRVALNELRETAIRDGKLYAQSVDQILPDTDIGSWSAPILAKRRQTSSWSYWSRNCIQSN